MNNLAVTPYIGMHALQIQNVKRNVVKKASVSELNHENVHPLETHAEIEQSHNGINGNGINGNGINDDITNHDITNDNGTNINDLLPTASNDTINDNNLNLE
jgi:hypothetical protein